MSIIKSKDGSLDIRVRALGIPAPVVAPPPVDPELIALRREVEALTLALASRDEDIADLRGKIEEARRDGEAQGRAAGLKEGQARAEGGLERLQQGIGRAREDLKRDLASMEYLAVGLAGAGLAKILGEATDRADLLTQIIRNQMARLEAHAVLRIEVSPADFPDSDALTGLTENPGPVVEANPDLASGACRIQLRLGALEVGLDQQWSRLSAILDDLAQPEAAA